jgi:hypothetical protein
VPAASRANSAPALRTVDGYNVLGRTDDGVAYWALSDIGPRNLENFRPTIPHDADLTVNGVRPAVFLSIGRTLSR